GFHGRDEVRRHLRRRRRAHQARGPAHRARRRGGSSRGRRALGARQDDRRADPDGRGGLRASRSARDGHAAVDRRADVVRAVRDGHQRPRPPRDLADRLAGRHRHRHLSHQGPHPRRARRPHPRCAGGAADRPGRRLPGRLDHARRDHAGPRRLGHHRGRPGRRHGRRRVRDLHGRGRGLLGRPARRARGAQAAGRVLRRDARDGGLGRRGAAAALRRVRAQPWGAHPLPLLVQRRAWYVRRRRGRDDGTPPDHRGDALDRRGTRHAAGRARHAGRGRRDLLGAGRRQRQRRHDHPERADLRRAGGRHVLHGAALGPPRRACGDRPGGPPRRHPGRRRGAVDGQGLGGRRRDALASGRRGEGLLDAGRTGHQHRDDLHLADQDLLRRPRGARRRRGARAASGVRPRRGRRPRGEPVRAEVGGM
ncbi:MAG: Aspartokinase, partial [uncultured Solirubrobacteraceae bacterium]